MTFQIVVKHNKHNQLNVHKCKYFLSFQVSLGIVLGECYNQVFLRILWKNSLEFSGISSAAETIQISLGDLMMEAIFNDPLGCKWGEEQTILLPPF